MKKLYYLIFISLGIGSFFGCETDGDRLPEFKDGATLRLQFPDPEFTLFNYEELDQAKLQFDMFTVNKNIDSANLYITYYNFVDDSTYEERLLRTFEQADFDAEGAIRDVQITPADVASQFGISTSEITGGDRIDIRTEVVLEDGRKFPNEVILPKDTVINVPAGMMSVSTSSFNAGFVAYVACPLPEGFGTGAYEVEQTEGVEAFSAEEVSVTTSSPIGRTFDATYFGFEGMTFNFLLVCGNVLVPATGSGLSCGGGTPELVWAGATPAGTYTVESDNEITIKILENVLGGCGEAGSNPMTLTLTKVE